MNAEDEDESVVGSRLTISLGFVRSRLDAARDSPVPPRRCRVSKAADAEEDQSLCADVA